MAKGGRRAGAGRKPGVKDKPHILQYWSENDIAQFFAHLKKQYTKSDRIATWIGDQISGKAVQPLSGDVGNPITVEIVSYAKGNTTS